LYAAQHNGQLPRCNRSQEPGREECRSSRQGVLLLLLLLLLLPPLLLLSCHFILFASPPA